MTFCIIYVYMYVHTYKCACICIRARVYVHISSVDLYGILERLLEVVGCVGSENNY
jgi:hypothetical protein